MLKLHLISQSCMLDRHNCSVLKLVVVLIRVMHVAPHPDCGCLKLDRRHRPQESHVGQTGAASQQRLAFMMTSEPCRAHLQVGREGIRQAHGSREGGQDQVAHLDAGGGHMADQLEVVLTQELRQIVQEHQQHPQRALHTGTARLAQAACLLQIS